VARFTAASGVAPRVVGGGEERIGPGARGRAPAHEIRSQPLRRGATALSPVPGRLASGFGSCRSRT
jgi:hypothetical protein